MMKFLHYNLSGKMTSFQIKTPLDLILKSFLSSPEFSEQQDKNWDAICRMVPGTTPKQVCVFNAYLHVM